MPPHSTTVEEEGVLIDNVLLASGGRLREKEILELLSQGPYPARNPRHNLADLAAQIAANEKGAQELTKMADHFGLDVAWARRGPQVREAGLARGPGNLCSALGITMDDNGVDLFDPQAPIRITSCRPRNGVSGPRVGVSKAADRPWRLWLDGYREVSAYRRSPRAPAPGASD